MRRLLSKGAKYHHHCKGLGTLILQKLINVYLSKAQTYANCTINARNIAFLFTLLFFRTLESPYLKTAVMLQTKSVAFD